MRKKHSHSLTKADPHALQNDDLARQNFTAPKSGMKYISDTTEIKCADGKLYLAAILDCFDGTTVGFAMRTHMRASLCCDALCDAVSRYGYQTGLILHSDHGSQYTSCEYRRCLTNMVRSGKAWDAHMAVLTMLVWRVFCYVQKRSNLSAVLRLHAARTGAALPFAGSKSTTIAFGVTS